MPLQIFNIFIVIFLIIFTMVVILFITKIILNVTKNQPPKTDEQNTQIKNEEKPQKKQIYRCDYCGTILGEEDKRCPGCGARRKVKKD